MKVEVGDSDGLGGPSVSLSVPAMDGGGRRIGCICDGTVRSEGDVAGGMPWFDARSSREMVDASDCERILERQRAGVVPLADMTGETSCSVS
jgi:hypothetical protein